MNAPEPDQTPQCGLSIQTTDGIVRCPNDASLAMRLIVVGTQYELVQMTCGDHLVAAAIVAKQVLDGERRPEFLRIV